MITIKWRVWWKSRMMKCNTSLLLQMLQEKDLMLGQVELKPPSYTWCFQGSIVCLSSNTATHQLQLKKELYSFWNYMITQFYFHKKGCSNKVVQTITRTSESKTEQRSFRLVIVFLIRGHKGYLVFLCCTVSGHNASLYEAHTNTEVLLKGYFSGMNQLMVMRIC